MLVEVKCRENFIVRGSFREGKKGIFFVGTQSRQIKLLLSNPH